jgi:lysozyme
MRPVPQQCTDLVKRFEGFAKVVQRKPVVLAVPYVCPAGYWTIGYGSLCQPDHPPITLETGEAMLADQLPRYMAHALRLSPVLQTEADRRLAAITSFVFNLGPTRYAGSTLRRVVNARDWPEARTQIRKWVMGGGERLPGLVLRREAEANLLG